MDKRGTNKVLQFYSIVEYCRCFTFFGHDGGAWWLRLGGNSLRSCKLLEADRKHKAESMSEADLGQG